jgi:DNA-binding response OmpR family regulator
VKKKILIVEDNKDSSEILGLFVTKLGHQVIKASNSQEAITYAEAECPDLIVMDLDLPDTDGIKTTAILKKNPKTSHIPVVAVTAWISVLSEITPVNEKSDENDDTDLVSFRNVFDELREYTSDLCFLCEELKFAATVT